MNLRKRELKEEYPSRYTSVYVVCESQEERIESCLSLLRFEISSLSTASFHSESQEERIEREL